MQKYYLTEFINFVSRSDTLQINLNSMISQVQTITFFPGIEKIDSYHMVFSYFPLPNLYKILFMTKHMTLRS